MGLSIFLQQTAHQISTDIEFRVDLSVIVELLVVFIHAAFVYMCVGRMHHLCRSYIAKENERRSTLGLEVEEAPVELEDNEELIQLGTMVESTSAVDGAVYTGHADCCFVY